MPEPVERYDPDGIDYGWIMQVTFILTIVIGAPLVAIISLQIELVSWGERIQFAAGIGAVIWFCTALLVYGYARWIRQPVTI